MLRFKEFLNETAKRGMGATTDNATITELFPALAFNLGFKPVSVADFQKWVFQIQPKLKSGWKKIINWENFILRKHVSYALVMSISYQDTPLCLFILAMLKKLYLN